MKKKRFAFKLRAFLIIPIIISLLSWWAISFYKNNTLLCAYLIHAQEVSDVEKPSPSSGGHDAAFVEFETYDLNFIFIWDGKGSGPKISGFTSSGIVARSYWKWPVKIWIWFKDLFGIDLGRVL